MQDHSIKLNAEIGRRIRTLRKRQRVTLAEVAPILQRSIGTISLKESGQVTFTPWELMQISVMLNVSVAAFFYDHEFSRTETLPDG